MIDATCEKWDFTHFCLNNDKFPPVSGMCPVGYTIDWLSLKDVDQIIKIHILKQNINWPAHVNFYWKFWIHWEYWTVSIMPYLDKARTIELVWCFLAMHSALRSNFSKSKDWLTRNQNNVSEWSDMLSHGLMCQSASTIQIQLSVV